MKIAAAVALLGIFGAVQAGCGSAIDVSPRDAVNTALSQSITDAGSDPADWVLDNNCNNMGNCLATLAPRSAPGVVVGTNIYVVKDSRPVLTGSDTITMAVDRSVQRRCLERLRSAKAIGRCIRRGA